MIKHIRVKKLARFIINTAEKIFAIFLSFFEVLFFLLQNRKIFNNELVCILYHRSFGHQIVSCEWTSRLFWPNKISFIEILMPGNNKYLSGCYENFDVYRCKFLLFKNKPVHGLMLYKQLKLVIGIISLLKNKNLLIDTRLVYKTLSLASSPTYAGNDSADDKVIYSNISGFFRLINNKVGAVSKLSDGLREEVKRKINRSNSNFLIKPFVTILLRDKESASPYWISHIRNPSDQNSYVRTVKYLTGAGFNVLGVGETNPDIFRDIAGFYSREDFDVDYHLLNLYALSECAYFIGQHSGPVYYADAVGIPVLLTDVMPLWQGTANSNDLLLYKVFVEKKTGKELSLFDICEKYEDLFYGINLEDFTTRDNTELEILESVKNLIYGIKKPDYESMLSRFHKKIPPDTLAYITKNRVPPCILTNSYEHLLK
jgi:putative glycosyltransferase (TIGR04372 family)